jgi:fused signal recognition particle receptor
MATEEKKRGFFSNFIERIRSKKPTTEENTEKEIKLDDSSPTRLEIESGTDFNDRIPESEQQVVIEEEQTETSQITDDKPVADKQKTTESIYSCNDVKTENESKEEDIHQKQDTEKSGFLDKLKPSGWFKKLTEGLDKTRKSFVFKMKGLFRLRNVINEEFWEELEEILISADVGLETTDYIVEEMKKAVEEQYISEPSHLLRIMKEELQKILDERSPEIADKKGDLTVIMVVGVNGTGKTTSIAKIAAKYMQEKKKVIIAAADTFRAAAIEQLEVWAKKLGFEIIKHKEGSDPAAVVFDAVSAAKARNADVLIIDTAGRLHSKINLMKELEKINRVIKRNIPDAPHETLLVLDATTGQNALIQAKTFKESVDVTGIVLTKLDGTAKGGMIIGIVHEQKIPVKFIGIGEGVYDLRPFDSKSFIDALFEESEESNQEESTAV